MPRRSQLPAHLPHKRSKASAPRRPRPVPEIQKISDAPAGEPDIEQEREAAVLVASDLPAESQAASTNSMSSTRQPGPNGTAATQAPPVTASRPIRSRITTTDYGYVVNEVKRIAITGGGIIILLVLLSRVIH